MEEKNMVGSTTQAMIRVMRKINGYFKKLGTPRVKKAAETAFVFFAVLLGWIVLLEYFTADKYQITVKVGDKAATEAVNADIIDYGTLAKGGSAARFIAVENRGKSKIYVKILTVGDISDVLEISKNDFTLFPQEKTTVQLLLNVPQSADKTQYKGKVVVFKIPVGNIK